MDRAWKLVWMTALAAFLRRLRGRASTTTDGRHHPRRCVDAGHPTPRVSPPLLPLLNTTSVSATPWLRPCLSYLSYKLTSPHGHVQVLDDDPSLALQKLDPPSLHASGVSATAVSASWTTCASDDLASVIVYTLQVRHPFHALLFHALLMPLRRLYTSYSGRRSRRSSTPRAARSNHPSRSAPLLHT